jgi:hypothetical protein
MALNILPPTPLRSYATGCIHFTFEDERDQVITIDKSSASEHLKTKPAS